MKKREVIELSAKLNGNQYVQRVSFENIKEYDFNYPIIVNRRKLAKMVEEIEADLKELEPTTHKTLKEEITKIIHEAQTGKAESEHREIESATIKEWIKYDAWIASNKEYNELIDKLYNDESTYVMYKFNLEKVDLSKLEINDAQLDAVFEMIPEV